MRNIEKFCVSARQRRAAQSDKICEKYWFMRAEKQCSSINGSERQENEIQQLKHHIHAHIPSIERDIIEAQQQENWNKHSIFAQFSSNIECDENWKILWREYGKCAAEQSRVDLQYLHISTRKKNCYEESKFYGQGSAVPTGKFIVYKNETQGGRRMAKASILIELRGRINKKSFYVAHWRCMLSAFSTSHLR